MKSSRCGASATRRSDFRLMVERGRIAPRRHQPVVQRDIGRSEIGDEGRIEPHQPVAAVQILEVEVRASGQARA